MPAPVEEWDEDDYRDAIAIQRQRRLEGNEESVAKIDAYLNAYEALNGNMSGGGPSASLPPTLDPTAPQGPGGAPGILDSAYNAVFPGGQGAQEALASAKRRDLSATPPMVEGAGLRGFNAPVFQEPTLEQAAAYVSRLAERFPDMAPEVPLMLQELQQLGEDAPSFKRASDLQWGEFAQAAKQRGLSASRPAAMPLSENIRDPGWYAQKLEAGLGGAGLALMGGAERALAGTPLQDVRLSDIPIIPGQQGLQAATGFDPVVLPTGQNEVFGMMDELEQAGVVPGDIERKRSAVAQHPGAGLLGGIGGALTGGGLAGLATRAGSALPVGAGLGGTVARGAVGAGIEGAGAEVVDLAQRGPTPGSADRMTASMLLGGGLSGLLGGLPRAAARMLRSEDSPFGLDLRDVESVGGGTSVIGGVKPGPQLGGLLNQQRTAGAGLSAGLNEMDFDLARAVQDRFRGIEGGVLDAADQQAFNIRKAASETGGPTAVPNRAVVSVLLDSLRGSTGSTLGADVKAARMLSKMASVAEVVDGVASRPATIEDAFVQSGSLSKDAAMALARGVANPGDRGAVDSYMVSPKMLTRENIEADLSVLEDKINRATGKGDALARRLSAALRQDRDALPGESEAKKVQESARLKLEAMRQAIGLPVGAVSSPKSIEQAWAIMAAIQKAGGGAKNADQVLTRRTLLQILDGAPELRDDLKLSIANRAYSRLKGKATPEPQDKISGVPIATDSRSTFRNLAGRTRLSLDALGGITSSVPDEAYGVVAGAGTPDAKESAERKMSKLWRRMVDALKSEEEKKP